MQREDDIKALVYQLDELVSKESACISFGTFGETAMYGNKNGYLRFGIELMKRAFEGKADGDAVEYMMDQETDFYIDYFETEKNNFDDLIEIENPQNMKMTLKYQ